MLMIEFFLAEAAPGAELFTAAEGVVEAFFADGALVKADAFPGLEVLEGFAAVAFGEPPFPRHAVAGCVVAPGFVTPHERPPFRLRR